MSGEASGTPSRWSRSAADPLVKTASLPDGAITSLLVGAAGRIDGDLMEDAYKAFVEARKERAKAVSWCLIATVLGLLVQLGIVTSASNSGIAVSGTALKPVALAAMSLASLFLAYTQARYATPKAWFDWKYRAATPAERAVLLLRYPLAFDMFQAMPANRGWPAHVFPRHSIWIALAFPVLALLLLLAYAAGGLWLAIALAIDVWHAGIPSPAAARAIVIGTGLVSLLTLLAPATGYAIRRRYVHYGLTDMLGVVQRRSPARHARFDRLIATARTRMTSTRRDG